MQPTQQHSARVRVNILHRGSRSAQPRAVAIVPSSSQSELTLARLQLISIRSPSSSLPLSLSLSLSLSFSSLRRSVPLRKAVSTIFLLFLHLRLHCGDFSSILSTLSSTHCIPGAIPYIVMQLRYSPQKKIVSLSLSFSFSRSLSLTSCDSDRYLSMSVISSFVVVE